MKRFLALTLLLAVVCGGTATGQLTTTGPALTAYPVFNVKAAAYGAKGDARKVTDAVLTASSSTVTSATAAFTSADIGKVVWGIENASNTDRLPIGTVSAVNSATSITVSTTAQGSYTGISLCLGSDDTNALIAANAAAKAINPPGKVVLPAGGYIINKCPFDTRYTPVTDSISVEGDGAASTVIFVAPNFDISTSGGNGGNFLFRQANAAYTRLIGITLDGLRYNFTTNAAGYALSLLSKETYVRDVRVQFFGGVAGGVVVNGANVKCDRLRVEDTNNIGIQTNSGTFTDCYAGNCPYSNSLQITSVAGSSNTGAVFRWYGGLVDESTGGGAKLSGSTDVEFIGATIYGAINKYGIEVDGTSVLRLTRCEVYGFNSGNRGALKVSSGGVAYVANCRVQGLGTLYGLDNSGTVYIDGLTTINSITGTQPKLYDNTFVAAGTTTAPTINKLSGSARLAAADTTKVVTNSLVTSSTKIILLPQTKDATATAFYPTPASGSFTITANAAATAETEVYWEIRN